MSDLTIKLLLEGLRAGPSVIQLDEDTLIRAPGEEELQAFTSWGKIAALAAVDKERLKILEKRCPHLAEPAWGIWQKEAERLAEVVTALRLFKAGTLGYRTVFFETKPAQPGPTQFFDEGRIAYGEGEYSLTNDEAEEFRDFWMRIHKFLDIKREAFGPLGIALSRFELSYLRRRPVDKLLDLVISMEALFLKEGERMELAYKLSQRAALLLENEYSQRVSCKKDLKRLYNVRSKAVHGAQLHKLNIESADVMRLKEWVRNAIKLIFELCDSYSNQGTCLKHLLERLDELALYGDFSNDLLLGKKS
ncbi:MAG: hypothetical protein ACXQTR_00990 [Candidatus Methanospirareceae archaeon]